MPHHEPAPLRLLDTVAEFYPKALWGFSRSLLVHPRTPPRGWNTLNYSAVLGEGVDCFDAALHRITTWEMHNHVPMLRVDAPAAVEGQIVDVVLGPVRARCLVVDIFDHVDSTGSRCAGMTYVATDKHPERGEETFCVTIDARGRVVGHVTALSRPRWWVLRPGILVQKAIARRYVDGMRPRTP